MAARIAAGYTIEHEELVKFVKAVGLGPEPGEAELRPTEAMMAFISWRWEQPQPEDNTRPLPRPQFWFDKDDHLVLAFVTRFSPVQANWQTLRFREMPADIEIRDNFIAHTGNVLDSRKIVEFM